MANGNLIAGFIQGYTGRQLDNIDQRRKLEAEAEKMKMLEQLRRETAEWEEGLPSKKQSIKESESRIAENTAQAKRDAERLALDRDRSKWSQSMDLKRLGLDQAQLAETKRYHNENLSNERKRLGLDTTSSDGDSANRVAAALKTQHKATIDSLVADGVDPLEVDDMTLQFVTDPRVRGNKQATGAELSKLYMIGLRSLRERQKSKP